MATNKTRRLYARAPLAPLLALATLFGIGTQASGQAQPPHTPPIQIQDNDTTRGELVNMDRFLDSHPEIAEQLRKDPSLINNATWVQQHPALNKFWRTILGCARSSRRTRMRSCGRKIASTSERPIVTGIGMAIVTRLAENWRISTGPSTAIGKSPNNCARIAR